MSAMTSEAELLQCFREIDRPEVELSPDLVFPLELGYMVTWAVGPRAFLVFRDRPGAAPRGMVFHRSSGGAPDVVAMCDWCHAMRSNGGVKLMTVRSSDRRHLGLYLCSDLGCERARRTLQRISHFASSRVF